MFRRLALRRRLTLAGAPPVPDDQLRRLARVLDAGANGRECVPAGQAALRLRLAVTRTSRFPELRDLSELRRLPFCKEQQCCNPYHWSRLCKPETPPPPYSRYDMDDVKPKGHEDDNLNRAREPYRQRFVDARPPAEQRRLPSYRCFVVMARRWLLSFTSRRKLEHGESTEDARRTDHERLVTGSLATDGEERQSWESEWCRLAYWELTKRVGRQFGVRMPAVDVFGGGGGACGSGRHGLCLDALDQKSDAPQVEQVRKTRAKIGLGVTLSLESDGVWLYNRSQEPVFVSSPALDAAAAKALLVWRVAPGHCLCIFDPACPPPAISLPNIGPVDPWSVRISFAKGWGPKYSRRDVTACPCWLEVLLAPPS
ncbi:daughters against dpp isoform 1-T1 [Aphomia sociella]